MRLNQLFYGLNQMQVPDNRLFIEQRITGYIIEDMDIERLERIVSLNSYGGDRSETVIYAYISKSRPI